MLGHFVTNTVVVIVVLGIMIFIHELGHFTAAKSFGVRVLVFSLGFGKTLFHIKRGETDYRISALPFGGYVKMAGDDPSELREGDRGEFLSQSRWKRFIIVVMGPAMNVLLAIVILTGLYKFHYERPAFLEKPPAIGDLDPGSPAAQVNLQPGDLILRFGSQENPKWEDIEVKTLTSANEVIPLEYERNGARVKTSITPIAKGPDRVGYVGWEPMDQAVLGVVEPGLPASKAGLQPGDEIVGIDGQKVFYAPRIAFAIQNGNGKPVTFDVIRAGKEFQVTVQPTFSELMGEKRWRVGFGFHEEMVVRHLPWGQALTASLDFNARNCLTTFDVLGKILTRRMSPRSLSGPIGIAQLSGEAYRAGITELLFLVSFISLQLGIFNLLPIPVLDGGVILLLVVEGLMRRDLSLEVKERFVQVGIVFLLLLAAFCMYNDLIKTFRPY
ncbi:MAG: RIP metalloprotease RseP [Acidobacteriota bacterium]|nr:RIP metalloprotease RseP [Acidobacteriota bacterium]